MQSFNLNKEQIELAKNQANKIKNSKLYTSYWNEDSITVGLYGEIAYGMRIGREINTEIWGESGDRGADFNDGSRLGFSLKENAEKALELLLPYITMAKLIGE